VLGLRAILEYPEGYRGNGDVDSGPVVFGTSATATAFAMGAALANGRAELFTHLLASARTLGPVAKKALSGEAFGNAVLLAQLTARSH
jgi:hypothetical protein